MISVKLIKLGAQTREYCLAPSSTLSSLLRSAGETFVSGSVTKNNVVLHSESPLYDGDKVYLGVATKGNLPFEVNFMRLGGTSVGLPAEDGYTIKRTLEQLDSADRANFYRADGSVAYEFRVTGQGQPVDENHILRRPSQGDSIRVICSQRVKGNE